MTQQRKASITVVVDAADRVTIRKALEGHIENDTLKAVLLGDGDAPAINPGAEFDAVEDDGPEMVDAPSVREPATTKRKR